MTFRLITEATADVDAATAWYEGQSAGLGHRFAVAVAARVRLIATRPRAYARVSRPPRGREVRQGPVGRFPFLVTYEVLATEVVVLSVGHARRRSQPWRRRTP